MSRACAAASVWSSSTAIVIGPTPPRNWADQAGSLGGRTVLDVSDVARVVAGIDDDRALLDPLATDQLETSHGDHDVSIVDPSRKVTRAGIAVRDGGVPVE